MAACNPIVTNSNPHSVLAAATAPSGMSAAYASPDPLTALLGAYPCGTLLLRDSLAASAAFLLPCLTAACVKQGHKVVVVAAGHSPAQHTASLKKLGVAAAAGAGQQQQQQRGPVAFVAAADALKLSEQQQHASCLQVLCQQVQTTAARLLEEQQQQQQQQPSGLTVLLDSLAVVWALAGGQVPQVQALLHSLAALGETLQVPTRLVLLGPRDVPSQAQLLRSAASLAHVTADILPLEGKTAALDGSMTVTLRRAPTAWQQQQQQQSTQDVGLRPAWLCPGGVSVWFFRCGDVAVKWLSEVHGKELLG